MGAGRQEAAVSPAPSRAPSERQDRVMLWTIFVFATQLIRFVQIGRLA
jgi:hypothetical protein